MGLVLYFGNASFLENTLQSSGAYQKLVPAVAQTLGDTSQQGGIPFTDPGVVQILNNGFPPQVIEANTNKVIDGFYAWLEGKAPAPAFSVDLTKNRDFVSENISLYAFNRLTKQPVCFTNPPQVNPFTSNCLPTNFDLTASKASFASAINQVFPKTTFSAADLPRMSNGESIQQNFPHLPVYFQMMRWLPWVFGLLVIGLTVSIIQLCRNQRLGFRLLGRVTLSTGVALLITPVLYLLAYPRINNALHLQSTNTGMNALMNNVITALSSSFYEFLIKAALIVVNIGLVIVLVEHYTREKNYAAVRVGSGVVSSNRRSKKAGAKKLKPSSLPLVSSEGTKRGKSSTVMMKFRKLTDKEWS